MESGQKQEKQLSFEFCYGCGSYLLPGDEKIIDWGGGPTVLCNECFKRKNIPADDAVEAFEQKYNL